ncbi:hypothetical protein GHT06_021801 [Daphnia sinensis]|uniref:Fucosyltransferase n=1 Tax=Daphnia sinensis TaxID=1820382 RepID=A0AAD5KWX7_9CRUS|nr:hypothetical protein GHT06_021801 [Daphnia sinensis]
MIDYKKYVVILLGIAFFSVSMLYYFPRQFHVNYNQAMKDDSSVSISPKMDGEMWNVFDVRYSDNASKTILFWTTFYGGNVWSKLRMDLNDSCPENNCRLTTDRRLLNKSDAVIFHFWQDKLDSLPAFRSRNFFPWKQIPPHFFNWTATYRLDSDLFGPMFYGFQFANKNSVLMRPNDLTNYYGLNITSKTKMAAWFVSNCQTSINREGYVRELSRYVQVDVFGKCLENRKSCPIPRNPQNQPLYYEPTDCDVMLERDYLFYLSFENSFCPDYASEKFFRAFQSGVVPVVFGGANYSLLAPPHSYINARDFQTPKLLAEYLVKLSHDLDLYSRYFDWRGEFDLKRHSGWCNLCKMLNDPHAEAKSYPVIETWFFDKYPCENYRWTNTTIN